MKLIFNTKNYKGKEISASLTVEASLVLPLFLFFFISLLYFMQLFLLQEELQKAITETGLSMARAAYFLSDFHDAKDAEESDFSMFNEELQDELRELTGAAVNNVFLKYAVAGRLNSDGIKNLFIAGGFEGIRFDDSMVLHGCDDIDIVIRYRVRIPLSVFGLQDMNMIQRVKLRGWNGHRLSPLYTITEEDNEEEAKVYVTESGTVYHCQRSCSHISLSIQSVTGKPTWQRNNNGGKYYPCEACCIEEASDSGIYYITSYGDRYHMNKSCSKIKRTVKEIPLSEAGDRLPCKRCGRH